MTDIFRYSICDPLKKDPIEMGAIGKEEILDILDRFPWTDLLDKMNGANESDIHFSPSLEFENASTRHGLSISVVEEGEGYEFYIFYKRPKMVTRLFGLVKNMDDNFLSDRTGQTTEDVRDAVTALITNDMETLESRWG
ncbi:hypothetical protein SAMN04488109_1189 [Chryseolinea serpens]|uniref:Uncharacterized protein n=1 Tax=Chryseolinea serpens TaxID=947013 RepID=A0A1M5LFM3_9BACT|nr:hypothetical protein [Chryseolinea serpens]SHG63932.1 hypothetical protein SAMN04488109_1189 [Chryseolinea serpens]